MYSLVVDHGFNSLYVQGCNQWASPAVLRQAQGRFDDIAVSRFHRFDVCSHQMQGVGGVCHNGQYCQQVNVSHSFRT